MKTFIHGNLNMGKTTEKSIISKPLNRKLKVVKKSMDLKLQQENILCGKELNMCNHKIHLITCQPILLSKI